MSQEKSIYICGPLTELDQEKKELTRRFYERLADICKNITGVRAFVPHEHYDPIMHSQFTPLQVDEAERRQVCERTSLLLVVAIAPSWGGGIEVEMANKTGIPVVIMCEQEKLEQKKVSKLLCGNPAVIKIIPYQDQQDALKSLREELRKINIV